MASKNGCNTIQIKFDTKSVKTFGALTADKIYMQIYDTLGSDAFIDFLKKMFKIHGRFVMILDNAPGHTSKTLNNFIKSMHSKIVLIYLPPHTPQLNPIEPRWTVLKRPDCRKRFQIQRRSCLCSQHTDRDGPNEASQTQGLSCPFQVKKSQYSVIRAESISAIPCSLRCTFFFLLGWGHHICNTL